MEHRLNCNTSRPAFEGHICDETDKVLNLNKFQSIKNLSTKKTVSLTKLDLIYALRKHVFN